jgi:hypothetical protein
MMNWLGGAVLVVGFLLLLRRLRLVEHSQRVLGIARAAMAVVSDRELPDQQKETAMQGYARDLFGLFLRLAGGGVLALLVPLGVVWLMQLVGLVRLEAVLETTLSLGFMGAALLLSLAYFWWHGRW